MTNKTRHVKEGKKMRKTKTRIRLFLYVSLLFLFVLLLPDCASKDFLPHGSGSFFFQDETLNSGRPIKVWIYKATGYDNTSPILFVLHGNRRNASDYRDQWVDITERNKALLLVPEFSRDDFPEDTDYNMAVSFGK